MAIKHVFSSAKADGTDATLIQPSNWNANHTIDTEVTFPAVATPALPASGNFNFYGKNVANRVMPAFIGPSGQDTVLQPNIGKSNAGWWKPLGNATTVPITTGLMAPTTTGTATSRTVATTNVATRMRRLGWVSAATAASLTYMYWAGGGQQYTVGDGAGLGGFTFITRFNVSDAAVVTGARQFIGMSTSVSAPTNVEPSTLTNSIGLAQISTDATQWYIVYGGSAAQTAIALGTTIGAPTLTTTAWDFSLFAPINSNNTVHYQLTNLGTNVVVTGTLTGTAGTALPLSTLLMAPRLWRTNNATALAVGIDVSSIYIETDQ